MYFPGGKIKIKKAVDMAHPQPHDERTRVKNLPISVSIFCKFTFQGFRGGASWNKSSLMLSENLRLKPS